jgi:RND family efflux transporter MFP subunit
MHTSTMLWGAAAVLGLGVLACRTDPAPAHLGATTAEPEGRMIEVRDTALPTVIEAAGIAEPLRRAALSTKLTGTVTEVLVQEGERVGRGQLLARIDARDVQARAAAARAGVAGAEAIRDDALVQARRFRGLYADSAATRAQLDAAETGLVRAEAGLRAARAAAGEVEAVAGYAQVRAPFGGMVTRRFVDPGAFVAPGAPVVGLEDGSRLRIVVTVAPDAAARLAPGVRIGGTIERHAVEAVIEGVVPTPAGALYTVNALVDNPRGEHPSGGAATLRIPQGVRTAILLPRGALVREGDLTGVRVLAPSGMDLRWLRLGAVTGDAVEVLSGLRTGDRVFLPAAAEGER